MELNAMRHAIALSAFGLGTTSPNPPVGCVILDTEGRIVGEGYHHRKGDSHAELNALAAAGHRAHEGALSTWCSIPTERLKKRFREAMALASCRFPQ